LLLISSSFFFSASCFESVIVECSPVTHQTVTGLHRAVYGLVVQEWKMCETIIQRSFM
jgi:hypothetical protein